MVQVFWTARHNRAGGSRQGDLSGQGTSIRGSAPVRFWLLALTISLPILAQGPSSGGITGAVTDPTGAAVAGARVTARNLQGELSRTVLTNGAGKYAFWGLRPGIYEVRADAPDFGAAVVDPVRVSVGENASLSFALKLGVRQDAITVLSDAITSAGSQTTATQVLQQNEIGNLPTLGRNYVQLTLLTPKVLPSSAASRRGPMADRYKENQVSFQGVRPFYNYQTMDGAASTVFITNALKSFYSLEAVQEFRVSNSLWTAEQGHAMGGIVNVITKSGTKDWRGSVYDYFRNSELDKADIFAIPGLNLLRANQFGLAGGGPIQKDRVFVFGNYEGQRQANTPQLPLIFVNNLAGINAALTRLGFPPETTQVLQTADRDQFLVRTDVVPAASHRLAVRYNFFNATNLNDRIGSNGQVGDPITPLAARDQHLQDQSLAANLLSFSSTAWVNDAGIGFEKHYYTFDRKPGVPPISLAVRGAFLTGADFTELATGERKAHIRDAVSWTRGTHAVKFGAEFTHADASQQNGPYSLANITGLAGFLADPPLIASANLTTGGLPPGYIFHANQTGAFIQDAWSVKPNVTVTLGLRYDLETLSGLNAITDSGRGNLQPRFGAAWSPARRHLTVRGGFGVYTADRYHPLMASDGLLHGTSFPSFNQDFVAANPFVSKYRPLPDVAQRYNFTGTAALEAVTQFIRTGTVPSSLPSGQLLTIESPDLPNPYARQWGTEIEYEARPDLVVVAGYSGLQGLRLPTGINRDLRPATATLPSGLPDYQSIGPNAAAHLYDSRYSGVYVIQPVGSSLYNAGTLTLRKRLGKYSGFSANYVFSKNLDDISALATTAYPSDPYHVGRDWSVSSEHAKHRLVIWLEANVPSSMPVIGGFGSTLIVTAQSPRFYNVTVGTDVNRDNNVNTDRPDGIGRNTFRGDDFFTIDLRLRRRFRPTEHLSLEISADLFNLLNRVNVTDFSTVYGQPTLSLPPVSSFGSPLAVANAFQTQLGLRVIF
jgi:hypothetical protein